MKKIGIIAWAISVVSFLVYLSHAFPRYFGCAYQHQAVLIVLTISMLIAYTFSADYPKD